MAYDVDTKPGGFALRRGSTHLRVAAAFGALVFVAALFSFGLILAGVAGVVPAIALLAIGLAARTFANDRLDAALSWSKGGNAEAAIGTLLDELTGEGFVVMHDLEKVVPGNVDHLVSGPTGVFMVETKFRSYRPAELGKAKFAAATIKRELGVWVTPVICLASRSYGPIRHQNVTIVGREQLLPYLFSQQRPVVDFDRLAQFGDRL